MDGTARSVEAASTAAFGPDGGLAGPLATVWSALGLDTGSPVRIAATAGIRYSGVGSGPEIFDWVEALGSQVGESVLAVGDSTRGVSYAPERLRATIDAIAAAAGVEVERLELPPVALVRVLAPGATCSLAFESGVGWRARMHSGRLLEASVYPDGSVPVGITVSTPGHGSRPLETLHRIDLADGLDVSAAELAIAVGVARGLIEPGSGANLAPLDAATGVADPRPPSLPATPQPNGVAQPADAQPAIEAQPVAEAQSAVGSRPVAEAQPEPVLAAPSVEQSSDADRLVASGPEPAGERSNGAAASSTEQAGWALPSPVEIEMWPSGDQVKATAEAIVRAPTTPNEAPTVPPMPPASTPSPSPATDLNLASANGGPPTPPHPADTDVDTTTTTKTNVEAGIAPSAEADRDATTVAPAPPASSSGPETVPTEAEAGGIGASGRSRRGEPADSGADRAEPGAVDRAATTRRPDPMPDPLPTGDDDSSLTPTAEGGDPHGWPTARPPAPSVPPTPPMPPSPSPEPVHAADDAGPDPEPAQPEHDESSTPGTTVADEHDAAATVPPAPPAGPSFSPAGDDSSPGQPPRLVPPDPPGWSAPGEPEATEPVEQDTILPGRAAFGPVPEHRRRPRSGGGSDRAKPPLRQRPGGRGAASDEASAPTPDIESASARTTGRSTVGWLKLVVLALFVLALALTALLFVW